MVIPHINHVYDTIKQPNDLDLNLGIILNEHLVPCYSIELDQ